MKKYFLKIMLALSAAVLLFSLTGCGRPHMASSGSVYANADQYQVGDAEIEQSVKHLEITWGSGNVTIERSESTSLKLTETCPQELPEEQQMHWWLDDDTLYIQFEASGAIFDPIASLGKKELTVSLPSDHHLDDVLVSSGSASIHLDSIIADQLEINTGSGEIDVDCEAQNIDISTASGKVDLSCTSKAISIDTASGKVIVNAPCDLEKLSISTASGRQDLTLSTADTVEIDSASGSISIAADHIRDLEANSASGEMDLDFSSVPDECSIDTASGDITLKLPEDAGFTLDLDTAVFDFDSEFALKKKDDRYICGDGKAELEISTSSGDIDLLIR